MNKVLIYLGAFKPPTAGHFEVINTALKKHKDAYKFIILIGAGNRGGITPNHSQNIWNIYDKYLHNKGEYHITEDSPVRILYRYAKHNPQLNVVWVLGARENNEDDFNDIKVRTRAINNFKNISTEIIVTRNNISATKARNVINKNFRTFMQFLPREVSIQDKQKIYNMLKYAK